VNLSRCQSVKKGHICEGWKVSRGLCAKLNLK
jgi:hypothetical protein